MVDTEKLRERTREYIDEVLNQKKFEKIDEYVDPSFVDHTPPPGTEPNREGLKKSLQEMAKSFPDFHFRLDDLIIEGNKACIFFTMTGTHEGDFVGIPASHKKVESQTISIIYFNDDLKAVENWAVADALTMMQQMGVIPPLEEEAA